jgi:hypothetical protein
VKAKRPSFERAAPIVDRGRFRHREPLAALWRVSLSFREALLGSRSARLHSRDAARSSRDAAPKRKDGAPELEDATPQGKGGVLSFGDSALAHEDASLPLGCAVWRIKDAALNSRDAARSFRHAALKDEDRAPKRKDATRPHRRGFLALPNGARLPKGPRWGLEPITAGHPVRFVGLGNVVAYGQSVVKVTPRALSVAMFCACAVQSIGLLSIAMPVP